MTTARPTRADRRMVRNRKDLLKAAETLFAEKGFERVTIDEIADAADLAKGTFYNHFNDKNDIARELAQMIREEFETKVGIAQNGISDAAERLAVGICVFLRAAVNAPAQAAIVAQMYDEWLRPEVTGNVQLRNDLENGYRGERFSTADLPAAVVMIVGTVQAGIKRALELAQYKAVQRLALALSELVLRALGMKPKEAKLISTKAVALVFDRYDEGIVRSRS
jgi:AcrR family transcriptional regulator